MGSSEKGLHWRLGFAIFCLVYTAVVGYLGLDNFDKVHGEYQRAQEKLQPVLTEKIALQELVDQCRRKAKRKGRSRVTGESVESVSAGNCRTFPKAILEEQKKAVTAQLQVEEKRFRRKLVVFSLTFGIFFVALPLAFLYLFLSFLIWIFKDMKFIK